MAHEFKIGDRVRWSSSGGESTGEVTKVHTRDVEFKGQMRRCSEDEPQYEVKSDTSGDSAMHKGSALTCAS